MVPHVAEVIRVGVLRLVVDQVQVGDDQTAGPVVRHGGPRVVEFAINGRAPFWEN